VVRRRGFIQAQERPDHALDLTFVRGARAAYGHLDGLGRVFEAFEPSFRGGQDHDPARLTYGHCGACIAAEVELLKRHRRRRMPINQVENARMYLLQPVLEWRAVSRFDYASIQRHHPRCTTADDAKADVDCTRIYTQDNLHNSDFARRVGSTAENL
jgi:hypothetical protein